MMCDLVNKSPRQRNVYLTKLVEKFASRGWQYHDALQRLSEFNTYTLFCLYYYMAHCKREDRMRVDALRIQAIPAEFFTLVMPQ
jgi:hypothetical protein